ncbi:hypothetical protein HMPREF1324_1652 [Rothia aeria F0474]|uniref:Uncharacterized protein n=1 Tax=Rothia aeria F0474 TaxID=1125724 RepID=I0UUR4_9MICC|nr:hypothetical protein HMPREF1324_1652 [Rothia aeria F0474]
MFPLPLPGPWEHRVHVFVYPMKFSSERIAPGAVHRIRITS